jgi:hypothetical protein
MMRFGAEDNQFNAPSRTIMFSMRMPPPIVEALYTVRENIAISKKSAPVHARAPSI